MTFKLGEVARRARDYDGRVMVLGGPGSGKTTLSLLRAQRQIRSLEPGQSILFLSFSRAAVRQVLVRCKDVLSAEERSRITVQTYHAFCLNILKAHGRLLTGLTPRVFFPDREKVAKASFKDDWPTEIQRLADEEGLYAFDTFAAGAAKLVVEVRKVAELIAERHPVIILDEFQDTSDDQWALVQALAERSEVMLLADPDQRIFDYDDRVDPERLGQVRALLAPVEFDLGGENHRSPDAGVLQFANAVLRNTTLVATDDVREIFAWPNAIDATVHAATRWLYAALRRSGIVRPSVAILARSNPLVADISTWLGRTHNFNGVEQPPVPHDVLWDVELSAIAAQIVASILEWPRRDEVAGVAATLELVADYYEVKNAISRIPIASAIKSRDSYRANAALLTSGKVVRLGAAKHLVEHRAAGVEWVGDPFQDWTAARDIVAAASALGEIVQSARFVRLFGATDEIGGRLSAEWDRHGHYGETIGLVRRTLDQGRLLSEARDPQGIVVMNVHKSKGKEFDGVLIVEGAYKGAFYDDRQEPPHWAGRRLLRVAITRARHKVMIIRPRGALPLVDSEA